MEIPIFEPYLSNEDKSAIEKKGFKLKKTSKISSCLYDGKVLCYKLPSGYKLYSTTTEHVYRLCHKSIGVAEVRFLIPMGELATLTLFNSNHFWD